MRKNVKKLLSFVSVVAMIALLGLYGCSGTQTPNKGDNTEVTDEQDSTEVDQNNTSDSGNTGNTDGAKDEADTTDTDEADTTDTYEAPVIPTEKSSLKVALSKESGVYEGEFDLEITSDGKAQIYYTTDGSNPIISRSRIEYNAPVKVTDRSNDENVVSGVYPFLFDAANVKVSRTRDGFEYTMGKGPSKEAVDKCTVIRAVALDEAGLYTEVAASTYFVGSIADHIQGVKESAKASGADLAIISLSMDFDDLFHSKRGIYVKGDLYEQAIKDILASGESLDKDASRWMPANYLQRGRAWERNVHVDFLESDGTTTNLAFSQDAGIRIQGNFSRSDLQKGFRLFARADYGKKNFEYPIFGEDLKNDAGETITKFKTLTLRNGGNTAFTTKFSDTYWQSLIGDLDCETQTSRPAIVYINGEYWGLYVLQEDYSEEYFENTHGVEKKDVVLYKGDGEALELGYKLDVGDLPEGVTDESYYFADLLNFFKTHEDLSKAEDYEEFAKLVDVESARDYFAVQIWINNKWDWPGKNWSMWKTVNVDESNPYADGRWRYVFYDVEFGGVMGKGDIRTNTIKENNYQPFGMLDKETENPAMLVYVYLMTNEGFRKDFASSLLSLSEKQFNKDTAIPALDVFKDTYGPLYDQFFARYPGMGDANNSLYGGYASYQCIKDFLEGRADFIQPMLDYVDSFFAK